MNCPVTVAQLQKELDWLIGLYTALNPHRVLEIGALFGGTLWHWIRYARPGTVIVVVDWTIYTEPKKVATINECRKFWPGWASSAGVMLKTIYGNSTKPETAAQAQEFAPYDFIFVDGGHLYDIVASDFKVYYPMLRPGGLMAFHDIGYQEGNPNSQQVGKWWQEKIVPTPLKRREMIEMPGIYGIGVIEKDT